MKKNLFLTLGLCSVMLLTGCKSRETAYRAAYEKAKAQEEMAAQQPTTPVAVTPVAPVTPVTPVPVAPTTPVKEVVEVTPVTPATPVDYSDVRTIEGGVTVVNGGAPLKAFSVVVGSFTAQANAEGEMARLKAKGYDARIIRTEETINGITGWYRVVASTFDDKPTAAQSRDELRATYPGAWLLYNK